MEQISYKWNGDYLIPDLTMAQPTAAIAQLKLLKSEHLSQQYRLEDDVAQHFPAGIERNKGFIAGFEKDMETLAAHPLPGEGFVGMVVKGDVLTDKDNAGAAILEACKEVRSGESVEIGSYRGFARKMAIDGYSVRLDLPEVRELIVQLRKYGTNLNQLAKRANEGGSIFEKDVERLCTEHAELYTLTSALLRKLAEL